MRTTLLLLALALVAGCTAHQAPPATLPATDIILLNGRVFTGDPSLPWAEALSIGGNEIVAIGSTERIRTAAGPATRIIDVGGRVVIPGINDAHAHAPSLGSESVPLTIPTGATPDDVLALVRITAAAHPEGTLLEGELPLHLFDIAPDRDALDAVAPKHRVVLAPLGGHSAMMNTLALRSRGIVEGAADPPGGGYGRKEGRLDGWVHEHALWLPARAAEEQLPIDAYLADIRRFEETVLRLGITSIQTMPLGFERTRSALLQAEPRLRWRVMDFRFAPFDGSPSQVPVKYIIDGTPIERGAAMLAGYADEPETRGRLNYSLADIERMLSWAATGDQQLLLHVVGDAAIDTVLAAMERMEGIDWPAKRVRFEHADMLWGNLVERTRRLGVIVVQNPSHLILPELMRARLGEERFHTSSPVRSLQAEGIPFAIGSDGPLNPFLNMMFAGMHPHRDEAMTIEQSLLAYTQGSAYAEFMETRKGRLMPGMLADLAVLSQDIFSVPPPELPKTTSVLTIVDGKVVWEDASFSSR